MQEMQEMSQELLTARQVQRLLRVDKSTVYRMAGDGRLPAIRVGKQWRFPADEIDQMVGHRHVAGTGDVTLNALSAQAVIDVMAERLGVMMVVTDLGGHPITQVANPCEWYAERDRDLDIVGRCVTEWKSLGDDVDLTPRLRRGEFGFECARAFIRSGASLVGMVLAGGVAPRGEWSPVLHNLDDPSRARLLETLPMVAALVGRCAVFHHENTNQNQSRSTT